MNKVEVETPSGRIGIGQYYRNGSDVYLLAAVGMDEDRVKVVFVNLGRGTYYGAGCAVCDSDNILASEFRLITTGDSFTRITSPITITPGE